MRIKFIFAALCVSALFGCYGYDHKEKPFMILTYYDGIEGPSVFFADSIKYIDDHNAIIYSDSTGVEIRSAKSFAVSSNPFK